MGRNAPSEGPRVRRLERREPPKSDIGERGARRLEPGDGDGPSAAVGGSHRDFPFLLKLKTATSPRVANAENFDLMPSACAAGGTLSEIPERSALRMEPGDGGCFCT